MEFDWTRITYAVPAMRGVRVTYTGRGAPQQGVITGQDSGGGGLMVKMDGEKRSAYYHPTWRMTYHPTAHQLQVCEARRRAFWALAYPDQPYQERSWVAAMDAWIDYEKAERDGQT